MHYALLGDIHSSKEDLEKVLRIFRRSLRKQSVLEWATCLNA